ncbi:MAG: DUF2147 domain-containing protein [Pelagimonas sp.]|jgi:uncharacterized protein (DUF2147 family)|nr:DUF2147 domain-containing protein [Pelagimonas sp.]
MKTMIAAMGLSLLASMAAADPVVGTWKTEVDDGSYAYVKMSTCGSNVCGVISRTFNASGEYTSDTKGKRLVWDMVPEGGGKYRKGKIWQPSTGKVYSSKMALSGNTLKVSGCVGPICKKQTWSRVK